MLRTFPKKASLAAACIALLGAAMSVTAAPVKASGGTVAYDSIPSTVPGNVVSQAFEATRTREFGDRVTLEPGTARLLKRVDVVLSSWACTSGHWSTPTADPCADPAGVTFDHPITLRVYQGGATPGAQVAASTQTFAIPYRPASDPAHCSDRRWYQASTGTCFNGLAHTVSFDFTGQGVVLPDDVIWTVAFNTSTAGYAPIGAPGPGAPAGCFTDAGCPYDSLNVGAQAFPGSPYAGTDVDPDGVFTSSLSTQAGNPNCDSLPRQDLASTTGCWDGFTPMAEIVTQATNSNSGLNLVQLSGTSVGLLGLNAGAADQNSGGSGSCSNDNSGVSLVQLCGTSAPLLVGNLAQASQTSGSSGSSSCANSNSGLSLIQACGTSVPLLGLNLGASSQGSDSDSGSSSGCTNDNQGLSVIQLCDTSVPINILNSGSSEQYLNVAFP